MNKTLCSYCKREIQPADDNAHAWETVERVTDDPASVGWFWCDLGNQEWMGGSVASHPYFDPRYHEPEDALVTMARELIENE